MFLLPVIKYLWTYFLAPLFLLGLKQTRIKCTSILAWWRQCGKNNSQSKKCSGDTISTAISTYRNKPMDEREEAMRFEQRWHKYRQRLRVRKYKGTP